MLKELFPKKYKGYLSLPFLGEVLDEFDNWLCRQGYTESTRKLKIKLSKHIDNHFQKNPKNNLRELTLEDWKACRGWFTRLDMQKASTASLLCKFLKEMGNLGVYVLPPLDPIESRIQAYKDHLSDVRGLESKTVKGHLFTVFHFLTHLSINNPEFNLETLTLSDIEDFITESAKSRSRTTMQHEIAHLRGFLRFLELSNEVQHGLCNHIDTPRVYRMEHLPRALKWETVQAFLESIDKHKPTGLRDYTMFFLMAHYGLRCCDIVSLSFDDIHWRKQRITISQRKTRKPLLLPLTDWAATVLCEYLRNGGRPHTTHRQLFLRSRAPYAPLKPTAVCEAFRMWIQRSGMDIPVQGPHCLRHSYAIHLLRQGIPVKAIGDILGHRTLESTCVYLRFSLEDLREVALPLPLNMMYSEEVH